MRILGAHKRVAIVSAHFIVVESQFIMARDFESNGGE
jgi:hypothetical protein